MSAQQKKHPFDFKTQYGLGAGHLLRDWNVKAWCP